VRRAVIVMAKQPAPGEVKTRLAPLLGLSGAAALYRAMLQDVLDEVGGMGGLSRYLCVHPADSRGWFAELSRGRFEVRAQSGEDLRQRIESAFRDVLSLGHDAVALRNSDSPTLPAELVAESLAAIRSPEDVSIGPDQGGGYYLLAAGKEPGTLLDGLAAAEGRVFEATLALLAREGRRVHRLPEWLDVDQPGDVRELQDELARDASAARRAGRTHAFLVAFASLRRQGFPPGGPARLWEGGRGAAGDETPVP
jgi:rSAM/selenodomain-associated transferase 1